MTHRQTPKWRKESPWGLDQSNFNRALKILGQGDPARGTREYLSVHQELETAFRTWGFTDQEDLTKLADETMDRVAQKLPQQWKEGDDPTFFIFRVARFVRLEQYRKRRYLEPEEKIEKLGPEPVDQSSEQKEHLHQALDGCLDELAEGERELILDYYQGEGGTKIDLRKKLATKFNSDSINALRIKAFRLRQRIENCLEKKLRAAGKPGAE